MQTIFTRRSIRRFTGQAVDAEKVRCLLQAAMQAPSAGDQKPWEFVVMTQRRLLEAIPQFHPSAKMVLEAPLAILVCGDLKREIHQGYWVQDCSAAVQNLLLAAHEMGLGAVWVGVYPRGERVEGMRKLLGLPEHVMPFALVPVGHPAEEKPPLERFDASRVHTDKW